MVVTLTRKCSISHLAPRCGMGRKCVVHIYLGECILLHLSLYLGVGFYFELSLLLSFVYNIVSVFFIHIITTYSLSSPKLNEDHTRQSNLIMAYNVI